MRRFFATLDADRPYVVAALEAFAQAARSDQLRARLADAYQEFREEVAGSIERAAGRPDAPTRPDTLHLSSVLIALFDGLAIQWLLDPQQAPDDEHVLESLAALGGLLVQPEDKTQA